MEVVITTENPKDSSQQNESLDFELTPEQENAMYDEEIRQYVATQDDGIDRFCDVCCCKPCCCNQMTDEAQDARLERQIEEARDEALNKLLERAHL